MITGYVTLGLLFVAIFVIVSFRWARRLLALARE